MGDPIDTAVSCLLPVTRITSRILTQCALYILNKFWILPIIVSERVKTAKEVSCFTSQGEK